ncbi:MULTISPECIES: aminoglycoside phosphotransferase family protein [Streptomyces]|uniref:Aminoglycoside phosphotransferase family protein n=1 Tax=Streptomyces flavovirens TaxID=52258 RepID=A0ABV8NCP3_9ACTN|nr:aminoglycoside phosphotransferase family protein [Streptomyces sp. MBT51]MBK3594191.1 aminoglycoside phosphotransferase family protein [Streptomyces sp. MBT51]
MHADETKTDAALVRRLIAGQFPGWADLPVVPVDSDGTVNALYRLGQELTVRLPRTEGGARDVETEHRWVPRLAPRLPFPVPEPVALGAPAEGYPWPWSVCRWLDGENPSAGQGGPLLAADLAALLAALRRTGVTDDAPPAYRSEPLASRDAATREALDRLDGDIDTALATAAWQEALRAPAAEGPGVWVHGDLQPGNVLVSGDRLGAVLDFGCTGVADPAVDLIAGWYLLSADGRRVFRTRTAADDAAWARGRGWALSIALMELAYYRTRNAWMASTARHVIAEILADAAGAVSDR